MTVASRAVTAAFASLLLMGTAFAQTPAPAPAAPAPAAKTAPAPKSATAKPEQSAASKECSTEADAKGLHGKERKKFRSECKRKAGKPG
ncbi:phosphate starvation-inducible protein PsiF [Bradyrhizobium sp. U87765 SZCCT0131]|uniref:PsiF family protein n=1 Tax=unclassified Bradyrhizobium TaxID=2631580 RepID=UPI001BABCFA7|nr:MULTISPECIES: PsiF family protein [unclassified Bradyrhizobium]MBR1222020.1 phosphate starvation-inducible protein PsiF [Bradyrhizobium sp. U87765 SZCCT0131]MBR1263782.1 phosphate starvation-inducible protein PsiF [Bradyrhizobium sp. U87765 SZCCT0134]MBR1302648.1 phosphate starvation-inducible protein PsiF [Bradyrhizobium sp. U87765 SZCCT0110]MBR1320032.1 phosphate starvation-inducible protein PsiF [Bradyrhizobium sp. U87765 SZCCT0109]MBR1348855.1 phosphate starvation-inducible protein PsiF